jgi:hypothetical protein
MFAVACNAAGFSGGNVMKKIWMVCALAIGLLVPSLAIAATGATEGVPCCCPLCCG